MEKVIRLFLFCLLSALIQSCAAPAKKAPTLPGGDENTYVQPDSSMNYIYRGPTIR